MNISNALFAFTEEIVAAAANNSALSNVRIQPDVYEEIKPGKTIRIDDLRQATPELRNNQIIKAQAIVNVFFIAVPVSQKLSDRLEARQLAEDMADAWLLALFNNPKASDADGISRFCRPLGKVALFNEWFKPGAVKTPVTVLRLQINP